MLGGRVRGEGFAPQSTAELWVQGGAPGMDKNRPVCEAGTPRLYPVHINGVIKSKEQQRHVEVGVGVGRKC